jgi:hypothetical protein
MRRFKGKKGKLYPQIAQISPIEREDGFGVERGTIDPGSSFIEETVCPFPLFCEICG